MTQELDLTPDPRVLQMLGEINLPQWRCAAELVDNGLDGLVAAARSGHPIAEPEISITIPTSARDDARLTVRDNGPGMSIDMLETAVRAGWSGNDSLSKLGLFGMGFNIATARLGLVTEVWTTRENDLEWVGVRIDLDDLRGNGHFKVPRHLRPKPDPSLHGTEIVVSKLKPDQRAYLARTGNQGTIRKHLARAYASLLDRSEAGRVRIKVNGTALAPRRHCVWDKSRSTTLTDGTTVHAVEEFDVPLAPRRYCRHCMRTLGSGDKECPTGSERCEIVKIERRVRGWVGLQRFLDKSDFGVDFIRNGRKIETASKDLFIWSDGDGAESEYPLDDPRGRGRFVGEVHIDHCRVSYTKDRFERDDPAWEEMVQVVRGDGPLRPQTAKQRGFTGNSSPLYKLFQAFRRSSPQGRNGRWSRVLVVKDNERAQQMAQSFFENDPDYLDDEPWWRLVEEQDRAILGDGVESNSSQMAPEGFLDDDADTDRVGADQSGGNAGAAPPEAIVDPPERSPLHGLTRKYVHPIYRIEFPIEAWATTASDPELPLGAPWSLVLDNVATRTYSFLVDPAHEIFRSTSMTPMDALLTELSVMTVTFFQGQGQEASLSTVLAGFRSSHATETRLDPSEIISTANTTLTDLARTVPLLMPSDGGEASYRELSELDREHVAKKLAASGVTDIESAITEGRFWEHMDPRAVRNVLARHPKLFFDGRYWTDPYEAVNLGSERIDSEAREMLIARYVAYIDDATWLAGQSARDIETANRDAVVRAMCSLRLLKPDVEP